MLLHYTQAGLLSQDIDGQTPLHCAVARSYSSIVNHLLQVMPKEGLVIENGVGNTPGQIIALARLVQSCKDLSSSPDLSRFALNPDSVDTTIARIPVDQFSRYEAELKSLMEIVPEMVDRGTVPDERKLYMKNEIQNWVTKMLIVLRVAKQREDQRQAEKKARKDEEKRKKRQKGLPDENLDLVDTADLHKTFELITNAYEAPLPPRRFIHLLDVQNSVSHTLSKVNPNSADDECDASQKPKLYGTQNKGRYPRRRADWEDVATADDEKQLQTFLVLDFFETTPDTW